MSRPASKSNKEIVSYILALEEELLRVAPDSIDYFPVIRTFVYSTQRPAYSTPVLSRPKRELPRELWELVISTGRVLWGLVVGVRARQLFVAPLGHRNTWRAGRYFSKHLDSLKEVYGDGSELVWEVGRPDSGSGSEAALPLHVARICTLLAPFFSRSGSRSQIVAIVEVVEAVSHRYQGAPAFDCRQLLRVLAAHDLACAYYRRLFARSSPEAAWFVVYYGLRHMPIIAALNKAGVSTVEYQHGVQNDYHPMYTHWDSLPVAPLAMPRRMLVWDAIAQRRIDTWARGLEISTEIVGNLWYKGMLRSGEARARGDAVLVALQVYPDYFNMDILSAMENNSHIHWIFREHPTYRLEESDRSALLARFSNLEIMDAHAEAVEDTLEKAFCCITTSSTVGVEALLFNRFAIFTHELAREGLQDYFDGERCFYAETAEEISDIVNRLYEIRNLDR